MKAIATSFAMLATASLAGCALMPGGSACDRACLGGQLDTYLAAIKAHDLAKAPLAADFRGTENGVTVAKGDGIAKSITALGEIQRRYFDPVTGQAAYLGLVQEGEATALTAIRIRVQNGKISESETFIARKGDTLFSSDGFKADPPRQNQALPGSDRTPRAQMIAAADSYFEGLQRHDGSIVPKIPGCNRLENGTKVTNRPPRAAAEATPGVSAAQAAVEFGATDCTSGLDRMTQISGVAHRRFPLVDEEQGTVMGIGLFLRPPGQTGNFAKRNLLTEFFDIKGGKVAGIYAVMRYLEADAPESTGWN
ncbi:MAG TPA: hypothetical protein VGO52_27075 [Hyphomonadaceae bacterium]|jgi:hypothetical protein|nr:hypothetical protein [Hyphomonadaceae bacterium]